MIFLPTSLGALRPAAGGAYLDALAVLPRAAWSLRKLISTATVALRVRRSSDSAELDIGFSGDALDTAALTAFVGAGSGFVQTWYDQTGNGINVTNATAAQQPRIVNAGVYAGEVKWDGVDDRLVGPAMTMGTPYMGIYATLRQANGSANKVIVDTSSGATAAQSAVFYVGTVGRWYVQGRNAAGTIGQLGFNPTNVTTMMPVTAIYDRSLSQSTESKLWHNGVSQAVTNTFGTNLTGNFNNNPVCLGALADGTLPGDCAIESLAIYGADTLALRTSIEAIV